MNDQELIEAVAEKVIGAEKTWGLSQILYWDTIDKQWMVGYPIVNPLTNPTVFNPLTNANHWWTVVERMQELGFTMRLGHGLTVQGVLTWVKFESDQCKSYHHHEKPGYAVCLAALEAMENA